MKIARVFPSRSKATPTDELCFFDEPPFQLVNCDEVHVSCTFTWDKLQAEYLAGAWRKRGYCVKLGGPAYGDPGGEFVPGRYLKKGYTITSRGCNNRCWFCYVWKREGGIRELPIADGWNVLDSNLLQCSETHIRHVFRMIENTGKRPLFTGGIDANRLEPWHVELFEKSNPERLYLAYDHPGEIDDVTRAVRMLKSAITKKRHWLFCYVLIGYPGDTFERAEFRIQQILELGVTPMAMYYRSDCGEVDPDWRNFQRSYAMPKLIYQKKQINPAKDLFPTECGEPA